MKKITTIIFNQLFLVCIIIFFSCKPKTDVPATIAVALQPDNNYAYSLIEENNGWHILRKDSVNDAAHIAATYAYPGNIYFADNSIYYTVDCDITPIGNSIDYRSKKCNIDGSKEQAVTFPRTDNSYSFVFDGSATTYSYFAGGSLMQQLNNADGKPAGSSAEIMDYNYFVGKDFKNFTFSPAAQCFGGTGFGYFNTVDVQHKLVKSFLWAVQGRSDIPYLPVTCFDEGYSKINPGHYRIFGASTGATNISNAYSLAIHCMMDTAKANLFAYPGTYYATAVLMDTIRYSGNEKYTVRVALTTDDQNLYVVAVKTNNPFNPTTFSADLIIYDKTSFIRKKYFTGILIPAIKSKLDLGYTVGNNTLAAVPSKNYVALLIGPQTNGEKIIKFDTNSGTSTDITPIQYKQSAFGKLLGNAVFSNNGRIYTMVTRASDSLALNPCSNIIYYE